MEKACDLVNLGFLVYILKRMGLEDKWIGWIQWCFSGTIFAVLVNGFPMDFFCGSRGLR